MVDFGGPENGEGDDGVRVSESGAGGDNAVGNIGEEECSAADDDDDDDDGAWVPCVREPGIPRPVPASAIRFRAKAGLQEEDVPLAYPGFRGGFPKGEFAWDAVRVLAQAVFKGSSNRVKGIIAAAEDIAGSDQAINSGAWTHFVISLCDAFPENIQEALAFGDLYDTVTEIYSPGMATMEEFCGA